MFIPTLFEIISRSIKNKPDVPRITAIIVNIPRILIKYILLIEEDSGDVKFVKYSIFLSKQIY